MLVPLMKDESAFVRQEAAAALGSALGAERKAKKNEPSNPQLVGVLVEALADKAPPVRVEALRSLGHAVGNKVTPAVAKLVNDPDVKVRVQVVNTLHALKDPAGLPALIEAAADKKAEVRKAAVPVLSGSDDPRAVACVMAAVKDKEASVREMAAQMRKIADADAAKALVSMLGDPSANVRILANNTLLQRADPITVPPLVALAKTNKDVQVRANAFRVLQYLAKRNVPEAKAAVQTFQGGK